MKTNLNKLVSKIAANELSRDCKTPEEALGKMGDMNASKNAMEFGIKAAIASIKIVRQTKDFPLDADASDEEIAEFILNKLN